MEDIDKLFIVVLKEFLSKYRSQRQFALKIGISPQYLNGILNGKNYGTDTTRRKIAASLGYPDARYEDFLNVGRAKLQQDLQAQGLLGPPPSFKAAETSGLPGKVEKLEAENRDLLYRLIKKQDEIDHLRSRVEQLEVELGRFAADESPEGRAKGRHPDPTSASAPAPTGKEKS